MSLSGMHSPHVSMSSDFSSSLGLAELLEDYQEEQCACSPRIDEHSPLVMSNGSHHKQQERLNATLLLTIIVVTIGSSLQFGYATGVMNNSQEFIVRYFHDQGKEYTLVEWGTTVSCYGLGGLMGAVLGPKVFGRCFGRRATLLVNNVFLVASSLFITLAPQWWFQAIGRVLVGIVAGIAT